MAAPSQKVQLDSCRASANPLKEKRSRVLKISVDSTQERLMTSGLYKVAKESRKWEMLFSQRGVVYRLISLFPKIAFITSSLLCRLMGIECGPILISPPSIFSIFGREMM